MLKVAGRFNASGHLAPTTYPQCKRKRGWTPVGASSETEVDAISVLGSAKLVLGNMRNRTPKKYKNMLNHRQACKTGALPNFHGTGTVAK